MNSTYSYQPLQHNVESNSSSVNDSNFSNSTRYSFIFKVFLTIVFLIADLALNSSGEFDDYRSIVNSKKPYVVPLLLLAAQVGLQIVLAFLVFLLMSGTYLFRIGLISLLTKYFRPYITIAPLYLVATIFLGILRAVNNFLLLF